MVAISLKDGSNGKNRQAIFNTENYSDTLLNDLDHSKESVLISSPSLSRKKSEKILKTLVELKADVKVMKKNPADIVKVEKA